MDTESSNKFIGSLTKFLQSLCNGYVEFDDGVELIGHIYLSVDAGRSGKTLNYFLNEKVCKNDNSVTFISNSFHAQPEAKSKASAGKDGDGKREDSDISDSCDNIPRSTNTGTVLSRQHVSSRSVASPNQNRTGVHIGTKRPGSPLKGPTPQRRAPTPPSQRRGIHVQSAPRGTVGSPVSKTVPSSPSSSSQDNAPSPSPARKNRNENTLPASNQSDNLNADSESDIVPPNVLSINPTPEFASFLGSLTSDNQTSQDQPSPPDTKPDTDVTFIKEEFVSEPSSCAQGGSSGHHSGRSGDDNSGLYPVMLHQNTSVFPSTSGGFSTYQGGATATATSQQSGFPGTSSSQSDPFNPVPGTSQDGADPSGLGGQGMPNSRGRSQDFLRPQPYMDPGLAQLASPYCPRKPPLPADVFTCHVCGSVITNRKNIARHRRKCEQKCHLQCQECGEQFHRRDYYQKHLWKAHLTQDPGPRRLVDDMADASTEGSPSDWQRHHQFEEVVDDDVDVTEVLQSYVTSSPANKQQQSRPSADM